MSKKFISKSAVALITVAVFGLVSCSDNEEPNPGESIGGYKLINVETSVNFIPTEAEIAANEAVTDFGYRFFSATANAFGINNLSVSPLSASMAISMVANSFDDASASEIANFVGACDIDDLNSLNNKTIAYLSNKRNNECIEIANSVWYADRYKINSAYVEDMNSKYFAEVNGINFTASKTPSIIDGWVSAKTHGIIPKISDVVSLDGLVKSLFINTLYFTGKWSMPFLPAATTKETFNGLTAKSTIDMMHRTETARYASTEEGEYVVCNFSAGCSMTVFMPQRAWILKRNALISLPGRCSV